MARPKEFDVDTALHRALEVFWAKGFEATSMQDLVAAMGIQKASLYGTFGDKRSLYLRALRRYQDASLVALRAELTAAGSPLGAIRGFLDDVAKAAASRGGKRGCFCVNANVEVAPHDPQIAEQVRDHSERVEAVLTAALQRARQLGELPRGADCATLATFVYGVIVAINVLGKQRASRTRLAAMVDHAMAGLGGRGPR